MLRNNFREIKLTSISNQVEYFRFNEPQKRLAPFLASHSNMLWDQQGQLDMELFGHIHKSFGLPPNTYATVKR